MIFVNYLLLTNIVSFINSTIFFVAVIAILNKLYSTILISKSIGYKYITSFYALIVTVIIVLFTTLVLIQSSDDLKWQFGFLVWLIYVSAILIIFTVVEALFAFEKNPTVYSGGREVGFSFLFNLIYNLFAVFCSFELWSFLEQIRTVDLNLNPLKFENQLKDISIFNNIGLGFSLSPKIYILSGLLQGLSLIIVVKTLR